VVDGRTLAQSLADRVLACPPRRRFWQLLSLPSLALAGVAILGYISRWFGPDTVNRTESTAQLDVQPGVHFPTSCSRSSPPTLHEVLHGQRIDVISIGFIPGAVGRLVGHLDVRQHDHDRYGMARPARGAAQPAASRCGCSSAPSCSVWCCCRCSCSGPACCPGRSEERAQHGSTVIHARTTRL